ncbi:MAG: response regulator [Zetaproteobacteria bacterium]|nr:response regulator [Zetaproteobacteria bacterium]
MKKTNETGKRTNRKGPSFNRLAQLLVVEDDPTFLKFFKIHLNRYFSKVHVVSNGKDAKKWLQDNKADLIITDLHMPKMNGFDLNKGVLTLFPNIPIIAITGALLSPEEEAILQTRFDGVLYKPFEFDKFDSVIQKSILLANLYNSIAAELKQEKLDTLELWGKDSEGFPIRNPEQIAKDKYASLSKTIQDLLAQVAATRRFLSAA